MECGSGASTLWLALAMRRFGIDGRIVALEHDPVFAAKTRDFLARHDVSDLAEVRDAPLEELSLAGEHLPVVREAGMEGPDGDRSPLRGRAARRHRGQGPLSGAAVARAALNPVATVVLDDLVVPDMQKVLRLWLDAYPEFGSEILPLEKQAAVLRRS